MEARLELKLAQKLIMTPQLQQAIKLLQLSRLELAQSLAQELVENPVLEEVAPDQTDEPSEAETEAGELPERSLEDIAPVREPEVEGETELKTEFDQVGSRWDEYIDEMNDG